MPLHVRSNFSFLEGASHPAELVETAHALGLPAIAITDRDGVYGIVRAHIRARELGLPLITGAQVTITGGRSLILLAQDRAGYGALCRLITRGRMRVPKGQSLVLEDEVLENTGGLIALASATPGGVAPAPDPTAPAFLAALRETFKDRLYLLIGRHLQPDDEEHVSRARRWSRALGLPLVASPSVLYHSPARKPLQDVLTCIRHGTTLADAGTRLGCNAEHTILPPDRFQRRFADLPQAIAAGIEIAARCRFTLDELRYRYPSESLPDGTTTREHLRELTLAGARTRYGGPPPPEFHAQIEHELDIIGRLDYEGYFLTMWEIVQFCRREGILCQGRGSAANSTVCYCLGITAIDPVRMELLFERFISLERAEPPDIDLDIQSDRREEVIQWVYRRYGRHHAAMVATVIRYRPRSAVRDVGRALGFPAPQLERLAGLLSYWDATVPPTALLEGGISPDAPLTAQLLALVAEITGFPRHLAIHPGGFLLGHDPVTSLVPIENATMQDRTVIQWDKDDIEALGLFKVDLLGLGMLGLLDRCFRLLATTRNLYVDLATIPAEDPATYDMCCRADTVGVFQIESRAQMAMLPRLRPRTFHDLVIQIAIIRPGPITGGMVHPYLRRRNGQEPVRYPHECLRPVLEKTLGVPLFQEQVMRLAVVAAGYSPGEADNLRRDMAAWRIRGRLERHHQRLVEGMRARGIDSDFAERVFEQIRGFGEYGFPESHAASFALIAYASAYLKRHFPAEFTCALLNAQPMGFYSPSTIVHDAQRRGVRVLPVDANASSAECTMEHGAVRLGLNYIRGIGPRAAAAFTAARTAGPFRDLDDFSHRTAFDRAEREAMATAGAFDTLELTTRDRRQALWRAREEPRTGLARHGLTSRHAPASLPRLERIDEIAWDYHATALSTRGHPMEGLRAALTRAGMTTAAETNRLRHGQPTHYVGYVICRQRPATANGVIFLSVEDETGIVNVVLWPAVHERAPVLAKTASLIGITGRVESRDGVVHLVAETIWTLHQAPRRLRLPSRDFT